MVLDADLGLGNLDVLLGLTPSFSLADVLSGQRRLREVLVPGPGGITVLPAGSGFQNLTALSDHQIRELQSEMDELQEETDSANAPLVGYAGSYFKKQREQARERRREEFKRRWYERGTKK